MSRDADVHDLGEIDGPVRPDARTRVAPVASIQRSAVGPTTLRAAPGTFAYAAPAAHGPRPAGPVTRGLLAGRAAGSLSIFLPGTGQMLAGEHASGLFFLCWTGLVVSLSWAIVTRFDGIARTLELLGAPPVLSLLGLGALYLVAAALHVGGVLHAQSLLPLSGGAPGRHPLVAGVASLVLPGWGQILNGCRARGAVFLTCLWVSGAGWLMTTAPLRRAFSTSRGGVPPFLDAGWWPLALLGMPLVVWALAIYDAVATAAARR